MRLLLAYLHAKTHYFINNILGIKHIIQFSIGILAGGLAFRAVSNGRITVMILILVGFSLMNQFFHSMFRQVHIANVVVKSEEAAEKTAQKLKERDVKVRKLSKDKDNDKSGTINRDNPEKDDKDNNK